MISGKTKSGFEYTLEENVMDNMELVDVLADESDDISIRVSRIVKLVLPAEQRKQLYDHHRTQDGRVPVEAVYADISEIFASFGQGKNS